MHYRKILNLQKFFTTGHSSKNRKNHLLGNKQKFIQLKTFNFCPVLLVNENEKYFSNYILGEYYNVR